GFWPMIANDLTRIDATKNVRMRSTSQIDENRRISRNLPRRGIAARLPKNNSRHQRLQRAWPSNNSMVDLIWGAWFDFLPRKKTTKGNPRGWQSHKVFARVEGTPPSQFREERQKAFPERV
ncbi:MAG: hypothetical protein WEB53_10835, partial [Akkermansiaceae bacterium]